MGEKESLQRTLFLPVIMILGILPLVVRAKIGYLEDAVAEIFSKATYMEFYAQGKAIILIGVAALMVLLTVMVLSGKQLEVKKSKYIIIYIIGSGLFLLGAILSTVLSQYKQVALFGIFDRAEGLLAIISYIIVMFYIIFVFNQSEHSKYIIGSLAFVIIISTILGAAQYVGQDLILTDIGKKIIIPGSMAELRDKITNQFSQGIITCTLYNPNYVGSFAAIVLPIFVTLCFGKQKWGKRIFYMVVTACALFLLVGSKSSAGLLATIMVIILALIILSKSIVHAFSEHKKVVAISGICFIIAIGVSSPLWFNEFKQLTAQIGETFFTHHDKDEYLQKVPIKNVETVGAETIFEMAEGNLVVGRDEESIYFVDENNEPVEVEDAGELIKIKDARFDRYSFKKFYDKEDSSKIMALGLVEEDNPYNIDGYLNLFTLAIKDEGMVLISGYSGKQLVNKVPERIGFAGKELVGTGRGYIWSRSIPLLKDTVLIGHGPDTYPFYFPQDDLIGKYYTYRTPTMLVDKPHNMYLQIGINLGCMALAGFLILVIAYMVQSIKLYGFKMQYDALERFGLSIMLGVFGYLIASVFNDSTVYVAPTFYALLGTGIAVNYLKTKNDKRQLEATIK